MRSNAGSISVEFGFLLPILLFMMLAAFEFGRFGVEYTRQVSAARAGAQYAIQDQSAAADTAGITQAARDDAGDVHGLLLGASAGITVPPWLLASGHALRLS
jgi:Flp pilus assembly protein TadG